jgi:dephospho-CoA kinase
MLKTAITGNIGCGKSTVAKMFKKFSCETMDADKAIKELYVSDEKVKSEVISVFGQGIVEDGKISTKKLADIVFNDSEKLKTLMSIAFSGFDRKLDEWYASLPKDSLPIVEAAVLFESGQNGKFDDIITVYAPKNICQKRAIKRGHTAEDFERRWNKQISIEDKVLLSDYTINNSGSLEYAGKQVEDLFYELYIKNGFKGILERNNKSLKKDVFNKLMEQHKLPAGRRFYHTKKHVFNCLRDFNEFRHIARRPDCIEAALIYHDIFYNPKFTDNEQISAGLAQSQLHELRLPNDFTSEVYRLIMATRHGRTTRNGLLKDVDAQLTACIDLLIFGKPESEFDEYDENIRKEYSFVDPETYARERPRILSEFNDMKPIYQIKEIRDRYEEQAHRNLERAIERLKK